MSRPVAPRVIFDGIPAAPYGATRGAAFGVDTYYIPISSDGSAVNSLQIQGDGTLAATATVQHTDFLTNLAGSTVNPRVAGVASIWDPDAAVGMLTILASATETGQDRKTWSNQPHAISRIVLVVSVGGRARGAGTGVS